MRRWLSIYAGFLVVAVVVGLLGTGSADGARQTSRRVYVSVLDKGGAPVTDLTAADFAVKEGGKAQAVLSAAKATAPVRVALIDSDAGSGAFQLGIARFIQKLVGRGSFSLISVLLQPERVVDYTDSVAQISIALERVGVRGRPPGGAPQVAEAILEAAEDVHPEHTRPVIVVMRLGGESPTELDARAVRRQIQQSGAVLYVVSRAGANRRGQFQSTIGMDAVSAARVQNNDAEAQQQGMNLDVILGDGSRDSGGRHEEVVSTTMVPVLEGIAEELANQYELTYAVADPSKPSDRLAVSTRRKGLVVHAPVRGRN
jgi:VWFA-related protein